MTIRPPYAAAAMLVLAIEVAIALFVHDAIVRPFVGDGLAVILLYLALRAVVPLRAAAAIAAALATAFAIEAGQLVGILDMLGLRANSVLAVVLGTGYDPMDFAAYAGGALCVAAAEAIASFRMQQCRAPGQSLNRFLLVVNELSAVSDQIRADGTGRGDGAGWDAGWDVDPSAGQGDDGRGKWIRSADAP